MFCKSIEFKNHLEDCQVYHNYTQSRKVVKKKLKKLLLIYIILNRSSKTLVCKGLYLLWSDKFHILTQQERNGN